MKHMRKILSWLLILFMMFSLVSVDVSAEEISPDTEATVENEESKETETEEKAESVENTKTTKAEETENEEQKKNQDSVVENLKEDKKESEPQLEEVTKSRSVPLDTTSVYKIFHLDAGRKYFSVDQIKTVIDTMAENDYNTLELAVGNDGLRFLLDDMSVKVDGKTYSDADVKAGIKKGNETYCNCGTNELTQTEMDTIIAYAKTNGISVIPLINTPGHMDAIVTLMGELGIQNAAYNNSVRTVDVTNAEAVNFTMALVKKYIDYFAGKGSMIFNMGCDEYANDIYTSGSMGFGQLVSDGKYSSFVTYVNNMAAQVQNAGMTAMAFNDGFYFNGNTSSGTFDTNIAVAFWSSGWTGYTSMSAKDLKDKGHAIINTNGDWYYVLGQSNINNVSSNINKTPYNSVMGSGEMGVAGSMVCFWCDAPSNNFDETQAANLRTQISTFAKANSSVFNVNDDSNDVEVTEEKTITISVGGTYNVPVDSESIAINKSETNSDIATVGNAQESSSGSGYVAVDSITSGKQYVLVNQGSMLTPTTGSKNSTQGLVCQTYGKDNYFWTITEVNGGYTIQSAEGKYLNIADGYIGENSNVTLADKAQTLTISGTKGAFTITNGNVYLDRYDSNFAAGWGNYSANENESWTLYEYESGYEVPITGVAEGTTYVTIGNTKYTVQVVAEDLTKVTDLSIEYWITNGRPTDTNGNSTVSVKAADAYSGDGIAVTGIAPANTTKESRTLQYWRCRLLNTTKSNSSTSGTERQTEASGDDETYNGIGFTKVRYWNGNWAVYTENNEWVNVTTNHQLVAYYLEILPVADELTVTAADWGKKGDGTTSGDYLEPQLSCTVSVQVVYEDGTTNPISTSAADLRSRTIAYGYWENGRGVGTLNLTGLEGYQIWKIEAETGSEQCSDDSSTWGNYTVTNFTWDNNAMTVYDGDPVDSYVIHNDAHTPSRDGYYQNLMWDENHEAILITVYVKAKPTDDNLKVVYYDEKFDDELYSYNINVKNGVTFNDITPEPSAFSENTERIDVTGCGIKNSLDVTQNFQTDLTKVPEAKGKYNSALYSYTGSVISDDGKTLYLYYNINTEVLSPMYVADFGMKITFPLSDVVADGKTDTVKAVTPTEKTRYGTLTYDSTKKEFTYTPTQVLPNIDVLSISILFDGEQEASTTNCGVMPATTVFYEEGFANYSDNWSGTTTVNYGVNQTKQIAGKSSDEYGTDKKYTVESAGASNRTQATSVQKGDKATFTFTGTGIDIYANTTTDTGKLFVNVKNSAGATVKNAQVDTKMKNGSTNATEGQEINGYNVPVVSLSLGTRDTYTVTITNMVVSSTEGAKTVNLDGFRVYGTIAEDNDYYKEDEEDNPSYIEMRDQVLAGLSITSTDPLAQVNAKLPENANAVVVASSDRYTETNVNDLLTNGPKNEIYIQKNQALVVKVTTAREVQLGLKALNTGTTYTINGSKKTISSSTDMFYTVQNKGTNGEQTITITNTGEGVLAVTKLKVCDDPTAALGILAAEDLNEALVELGITEKEEAIEPEVTYADAILTVKVNDAETVLTKNGAKGETATFTADEIERAAETLVVDGYKLDDVSYSDVEVVYGEEDVIVFTAKKTIQDTKPTVITVIKKVVQTVANIFGKIFGWR